MNFLTYLFYGLPSLLVLIWWTRRRQRLEKISAEVHEETRAAGLTESASLHPIIDPMRCIACGNCVWRPLRSCSGASDAVWRFRS